MVPVPPNIQAYLHTNNLPNLSYASDNDASREASHDADNTHTRSNTGDSSNTDSITQKEKRCASATFTRDFKYKKMMSCQGYLDPLKSSLSSQPDPCESLMHQPLEKSVSEHKSRHNNHNSKNNTIMNGNNTNGIKLDNNKNHNNNNNNNNNNHNRTKSKSLSKQISSKIPRFLKSSSSSSTSNEHNIKQNTANYNDCNGFKENSRYAYYNDDNNDNNNNHLSSSHSRYSSLDSEDSSSIISDFSFTTNSSLSSSLNISNNSHYYHNKTNGNNNNGHLTTPPPHGKRNIHSQRDSTSVDTVIEQRRCHSALSYRSTKTTPKNDSTSTSIRPSYQRERSGIPVSTKNKKYRSKSCERRPIRSKTSPPPAAKAEPQRPKSSVELRTPSSTNRCRSPGIPIRINSANGRRGRRTQQQHQDDDVFVTSSSPKTPNNLNLMTSRQYYCNSSSYSAPYSGSISSRDYVDGFSARSSSPTSYRNCRSANGFHHNHHYNGDINSSHLRRPPSSCGGSSSGGTTTSVSRSLEYEAAELKVISFSPSLNGFKFLPFVWYEFSLIFDAF